MTMLLKAKDYGILRRLFTIMGSVPLWCLLAYPAISCADANYCSSLTHPDFFTSIVSGCTYAFFYPSDNDLSLVFLQTIFGAVGSSLAGFSNPLVAKIFYVFNMGILMLSSVLVGYSTFLSVLNNSQDGSMMQNASKGLADPWTNMRIVVGSALLFPAFNGYSSMQVLVMYVIVQGVGLADTIWSESLQYLKSNVSTPSSTSVYHDHKNLQQLVTNYWSDTTPASIDPVGAPAASSFIDNIYQSSLCWAANRTAHPLSECKTQCLNPFRSYSTCFARHTESWADFSACNLRFSGSSPSLTMTFPFECGTYTFTFPFAADPLTGVVDPKGTQLRAMQNALTALVGTTFEAANSAIGLTTAILRSDIIPYFNPVITDAHFVYNDLDSYVLDGACTASRCLQGTTYIKAAWNYLQAINTVHSDNQPIPSGIRYWMLAAEKQGWSTAGMYFFHIAHRNLGSNAVYNYSTNSGPLNVDKYIALPENKADNPDLIDERPTDIFLTARLSWSYLTQFTTAPHLLRSKKFDPSCPLQDADHNQTASCFAATKINQAINLKIAPDGERGTSADLMYQQFMQSMFIFLKKIDQHRYTLILPQNAYGWVNLGRCDMIMPLARFNRMVLGGMVRIITGLHVDFWDSQDYDATTRCSFDGSLNNTVRSIISGNDTGSGCSTDIADNCIADLAHCTASNIRTCLASQTGIFPALYAQAESNPLDPINSASQMGIKLMAITMNYWTSVTKDIFDIAVASSWSLFGIALPFQILADTVAGSSFATTDAIPTSILYALINAAITVMKIFFETSRAVLELYFPIGISLAAAAFSIGLMIGLYIPLIPLVLFTLGVIKWLMAVIEAMVAAPLIALGIMHPDGSAFLGKADQAFVMLFSLLLRPSAIIIGLIMGTMLCQLSVILLDYSFLYAFTSINKLNAHNGMVATALITFLSLLVYVYILISIINQSYSLIYLVPERLLRWISGLEDTATAPQTMDRIKSQLTDTQSSLEKEASAPTNNPTSAPGTILPEASHLQEKAKPSEGKGGEKDGAVVDPKNAEPKDEAAREDDQKNTPAAASTITSPDATAASATIAQQPQNTDDNEDS